MATRKKTPQILGDESPQTPPASPSRRRSTRRSTKKVPSEPTPSAETQPLTPTPSSSPVPVCVAVTAPAQLASAIRMSFRQALEAYSDIRLVETGADWSIVILGVGIQTTGHNTDGVALSVTVVQALDVSDNETQTPLPPEGLFHTAWLRVGASTDLERLCSQLATNFHDRYVAVAQAPSSPDHPA